MLGKHNPADPCTKYLDQSTSEGHTETMDYMFTGGRAKEAPRLHGLWQTVGEYLMNGKGKEWAMIQLLTEPCNVKSKTRNRGLLGAIAERELRSCGYCESNVNERRRTTNGFFAAGAPGDQLVGTGGSTVWTPPSLPALGFGPNLPA